MKSDAYEKALDLIALADHSSRMMREKLIRKGYSREEVNEAVGRLCREGYINDGKLLHSYVGFLANRKCYGRPRIRLASREKFDAEIIENGLEEALEEQSFLENALKYAEKYKGKGKDYMVRRLKYLGHSTHDIITVVNEVFGKEDNE